MKAFLFRFRVYIIFIITIAIVVSSLLLAYAIRFDFLVPQIYWQRIFFLLPFVLVIKSIIFWQCGCFRGWWRYVSFPDLISIAEANLIASAVFSAFSAVVFHLDMIPRSVLILDGILCFLLICGVRFSVRAIREQYFPLRRGQRDATRVLIVGAGDAGQMIAREIRQNPKLNLAIVGFVDDDTRKTKSLIQGFKVLGTLEQIGSLSVKYEIAEIIVAIPSATGKQLRRIVEKCRECHVKFKTLPGVGDLIGGAVSVQQIREINLNDLLGREPIQLDEVQINDYLRNKRVLVTGAGGSIGSELCRQIARFSPGKIILFENAETPLFSIEQELSRLFPEVLIAPIIGDIRMSTRVNAIFDEQMPQVVFHAAAYKHVPMMEKNPAEAVNNNIQGTCNLADAADFFKVEKFVMVSTDKAVRPTNVMGATKRVAELYVQSLDKHSQTRFVTTRFGNVLGSNGSVIPTFKEQLKKGGPLTVTHPEVIRYFMTIPEAVQLVLQAGSMGNGGEVFLFDMGEPVKIKFLAEELIRLSGFMPYEDIDIVYTGLRPGEKLYEELLLADEGVLPTPHKQICVAQAVDIPYHQLKTQIDSLVADARALDISATMSKLRALVPEYRPQDDGRGGLPRPMATSSESVKLTAVK